MVKKWSRGREGWGVGAKNCEKHYFYGGNILLHQSFFREGGLRKRVRAFGEKRAFCERLRMLMFSEERARPLWLHIHHALSTVASDSESFLGKFDD